MALIRCPECNHECSDNAKSCPNCGYKIRNKKSRKVIIILISIIIFIIITIATTLLIVQHNKKPEIEQILQLSTRQDVLDKYGKPVSSTDVICPAGEEYDLRNNYDIMFMERQVEMAVFYNSKENKKDKDTPVVAVQLGFNPVNAEDKTEQDISESTKYKDDVIKLFTKLYGEPKIDKSLLYDKLFYCIRYIWTNNSYEIKLSDCINDETYLTKDGLVIINIKHISQ